MKKILHIIPTLSSGGAERQLVNLIEQTSANEFSHLVCVFNNSDFLGAAVSNAGYDVCELGVTGKHPWFSSMIKLRSIIRHYHPDIIKTWLYDANIAGRLSQLWNFKIPIITTLHSSDYEPETIRAANWSPLKVEGLRQIDRFTLRLTNSYFAACSNFVKKSFQKQLKITDSHFRVIYNGVNPATLECADEVPLRLREELKIDQDGFVFITVGRVDAMKNQELLLRAFPQVLIKIPQAYLVIVGTGILEDRLKKLAQTLEIDRRVRFLGRRGDIGACLEMADVFVFPTLLEGHPLALIEAMFKKLPCVASNIEVLREVLIDNDNCLLFDSNDADKLAAAMIKLYSDPALRDRLSKKAFIDAERRFHIRIIASEWENYYRFVIDQN